MRGRGEAWKSGYFVWTISYSMESQGCSFYKVITQLAYSPKQISVSRLCGAYNDSRDIIPIDEVYMLWEMHLVLLLTEVPLSGNIFLRLCWKKKRKTKHTAPGYEHIRDTELCIFKWWYYKRNLFSFYLCSS